MLIVADRNGDFNFPGESARLEDLVAGTFPVQRILWNQAEGGQARAELLACLNAGPWLVDYLGHGSVEVWGGGDLLTVEDASELQNGTCLPVVVSMTCLNGFFHDVYTESLAEVFLRAERGGAIAVWTSSGLTSPPQQLLANRELFRVILEGGALTLGEAALEAKAAVKNPDVKRTWILFGDPALRIR